MNVAMRIAGLLVAGAVVIGAGPQQTWAGKPTTGGYTFVTLDNRPGLVASWVSDLYELSGSFLCVGHLDSVDGEQAVVWQVTPSGSTYTVATHVLTDGQAAVALNSHGAIVGQRYTFDPSEQVEVVVGLYWSDRSSLPRSLSPLDGDNGSYALGINAAGVIVGRSSHTHLEDTNSDGVLDVVEVGTAVVWRVVGSMIQGPFALGTPSNPLEGTAHDINETDAAGRAQIVGNTTAGPCVWEVDCLSSTLDSTGPVSLVPPSITAHGWAMAINAAGDACGRNRGLAFRSTAVGTFQELSTPRGATSEARDINDAGQVVGQVQEPGKGTPGALWQPDGSRVYLYSFLSRTSDWERIWRGNAITTHGTIGAVGAKNGAAGNETRALLMIAK